jgi:hypothetical protein
MTILQGLNWLKSISWHDFSNRSSDMFTLTMLSPVVRAEVLQGEKAWHKEHAVWFYKSIQWHAHFINTSPVVRAEVL